MKLTVLYVLLFLYGGLMAQKQQTWTVKAGERVQDVIPLSELFRYDVFQPGTVYFNDGKLATARMNVNMMLGEVQFMDPKGDTLSLANEKTIRLVVIGTDSFIVNSGCWRYVKTQSGYGVVEKLTFQEFIQKGGAYGLASSTSATESLSSLVDQRAYTLSAQQERVIVKSTQYGIVNQGWQLIYPDRKKIVKILTKHKTPLNNYFSSNPVTANKLGDFEKLVDFLSTLSN
ncbi:MAG: hypothetical protein EOP49_11440 [Sphingobacteriales bacterium]|nr:MAG: hypothetical protein EOP49_11440 [Sphingobacteriales bacterium]